MKTTVSAKILAIRAKAGNQNTVCPTCGKAPSNPFRVYQGSKVLYGCIDAIHTGHLVSPSDSEHWHAQGETLRRVELQRLKS